MDWSRVREAIRQGCVDPFGSARYHGGKGSAPPAPDYAGAATAQGAANKDAAIATAQLSNPNVTNPYGSQTVSYRNDPVTGNPVPYVNQSLSEVGQQRFDQNNRIDTGLGNIAEQGLGYVKNQLDSPFDQSVLPERTLNAGQTGQDAIMSRLQPNLERQREQLRTQLYGQGVREGSEAFNNAMSDQNQRENDLLTNASLQGIQLGDQARNSAIQEQSFFRNEPLNMLNAVRSASPVNVPQFQGYNGANVAPAPIFGATQAQGANDMQRYGINQAGDNAMMQGLFSLGSAGVTKYSDRRLKTNVERIGTHPLGIGVYEYDIFDRREVGVMADEVMTVKPEAVSVGADGFYRVNYGDL